MEFTVKAIDRDFTFSDVILVPRKFRGGIKAGRCCKLISPSSKKVVQIYGKTGVAEPFLYMDRQTREHFGLTVGAIVEFKLQPVGWVGQIIWAFGNADLTVRVGAQLAILSLILGVVGAVLGAVGLWISLHPPH